MKLSFTCLLSTVLSFTFGQISCQEFQDSISLTSDTIYINQPADSVIDIGVQWMGHTDLSYMGCEVNYTDSNTLHLSGATVTGGLFSPYPAPFFFSININYLQPSLPQNTVIKSRIDFFNGNLADTCSAPLTFIVNTNSVSIPNHSLPTLNAHVSPNPMQDHAVIEVRGNINSKYQVLIRDLAGKEIFISQLLNSKSYTLERSIFPKAGLYLIEITSKNGNASTTKLFVQ